MSDMANGNNGKPPQKEGLTIFSSLWRIIAIFLIGFSVFLVISAMMLQFLAKPEREITVPGVTGKQFMDVYSMITRKGLVPEITFAEIYDMNDGIILEQFPPPGRVVSSDTKMRLKVSRSNILISVPDLVGSPASIAENTLKNLHIHDKPVSLPVGQVTYLPSESVPQGIVMAQRPDAGEYVRPNHRINMLISSGTVAPDRTMPDMAGQSVDLCFDLLLANGWYIDMDVVNTGDPSRNGIIFRQTPGAGAVLREGGTVRLGVYHYPLRERPYSAYDKVTITVPETGEAGTYEAYVSDNHSKRTVFYNRIKPGDEISFVFFRTGNAKIHILRDKKTFRVYSINAD